MEVPNGVMCAPWHHSPGNGLGANWETQPGILAAFTRAHRLHVTGCFAWMGFFFERTLIPTNIYWGLSHCKHICIEAVRYKPSQVNPAQRRIYWRNVD